jgi:hypothetical protein
VTVTIPSATKITAEDALIDNPDQITLKEISPTSFSFGIDTEHLIFSHPVKIEMAVDYPEGTTFELQVLHA